MPIKYVFFDLDHTLWDFERNSTEMLGEVLDELGLIGRNGLSKDLFIAKYHSINDRMWDLYRRGEIDKQTLRNKRFEDTLELFSIREDGLGKRFADMYLDGSPKKKHLFDGALEILESLSQKYPIYLLTNGFSEVQDIKIRNTGIDRYITRMITSEEAGAKKPAREMFDYAIRQTGADPLQSIMIGDDLENDVMGALNADFAEGVFFNPKNSPIDITDPRIHHIQSLRQIPQIIQ